MDSETTGKRAGVSMAEGSEPAATRQDTASRTLAQRMAAIRDESFGVGKTDITMGSFKIKAHTVEGVLSEMRPLFTKHGVDFTPNLVERTYTGNRCDVIVDFEFESLDDPDDRRTIRWAGAGTDNGDKAFAKAGTNALKEMLKKRFLITDRDDAKEETESVEHQTADQATRADLDRARESARANLEKWATAARAAFMSADSLPEVTALEREHREQLTSPDMPPATRAFFIQLIEDKKTALKTKDQDQ